MGKKELNIQSINASFENLEDASVLLKDVTSNKINQFPWEVPSDKPTVYFKIAHDSKNILLHYCVFENEMLARYSKPNEPVYTDSCVEFFIQFEGDKNYYNLEFNCLGNCLSAYGSDRNDREPLTASLINKIQSQTKINRKEKGYRFNWQLTLVIPSDIFIHNKINLLNGLNAKANFYKCGDNLSEPHFISWNNIETTKPDFHQSNFFGNLRFL